MATIVVGAASDVIGGLLHRDPRAVVGASTTLEATAGYGPTVRRQVALTIGTPQRDGEVVTVPIGWHAEAHEDLFPTFDGALAAEPYAGATRLRLTGTYAVPLGLLGRFGNGVLGRRIAQQSVARWLEDLARVVDAAARDGAGGEYEATVHEPMPSELYIG